jgi:hypothetical protein
MQQDAADDTEDPKVAGSNPRSGLYRGPRSAAPAGLLLGLQLRLSDIYRALRRSSPSALVTLLIDHKTLNVLGPESNEVEDTPIGQQPATTESPDG